MKAKYLGRSCLKDDKGQKMECWECGNCRNILYAEEEARGTKVKCRNCIDVMELDIPSEEDLK